MKFEDIKKLHQRKYREEFGCFLLEGEHLVQELQKAAVHDARLRVSEIYFTREYAHWTSQLATHVVNSRHMTQLSETRAPQGIAAVVPLLTTPAPRVGERAIYLHEIQDPGNLGTILRTLAWFGNFRCLLSPDSVDVYNGKAVRASMGAIFHVPVEIDVEIDALHDRFERIASLDLAGDSIASPAFRDFQCYVFGNEARGLPRDALADLKARPFTIEGSGVMESLNVAAALTICQYELHRSPRT
ncbi:MAG TPA: RNA methyltransferase [Steroidobacteraceae bacterium]|nr:RNA methyltransferase [Steroidobacteraceae bacterium]